ncbi:MAG TPA: TlpA disulfide reductase family protein [Gammaproteobacteria bacterium]
MSRPLLLTLLLSAAAAAGYVAYRLVSAPAPVAPGAEAPAAADAAPERRLVDALPEFYLDDLEGQPTSIRSWPGQPLIVNFWATWCAPCLREIPMLKELQAANPWLTVVGIALDQTEPVRQFAADMRFNYPILVGQADGWEAATRFGVDFYALPFTVFTAADGHVLGVHTGELHREHLDNVLAVLEDLRGGRADLEEARARIAGRR